MTMVWLLFIDAGDDEFVMSVQCGLLLITQPMWLLAEADAYPCLQSCNAPQNDGLIGITIYYQ